MSTSVSAVAKCKADVSDIVLALCQSWFEMLNPRQRRLAGWDCHTRLADFGRHLKGAIQFGVQTQSGGRANRRLLPAIGPRERLPPPPVFPPLSTRRDSVARCFAPTTERNPCDTSANCPALRAGH